MQKQNGSDAKSKVAGDDDDDNEQQEQEQDNDGQGAMEQIQVCNGPSRLRFFFGLFVSLV